MADFLRKIRKDGATFMRDRVAPRVREQITAAQQRAANATKRDASNAPQRGTSERQSQERLKAQSRDRLKPRQASWPERSSTKNRAPQTEGQPTPKPAPRKPAQQKPAQKDSAPQKPAQEKPAQQKTAQQSPTPQKPTQPKKAQQKPQPPRRSDSENKETKANQATKAPKTARDKNPQANKAEKRALVQPAKQEDKASRSPSKGAPAKKDTNTTPRPAAAHMKRIREEREARLSESRSAGRYSKSKSALPKQKGNARIAKTGTRPQPAKASTGVGGTPSKALSASRRVNAREAAAKRAKSAELRQKTKQKHTAKQKPSAKQEYIGKQGAASSATPKTNTAAPAQRKQEKPVLTQSKQAKSVPAQGKQAQPTPEQRKPAQPVPPQGKQAQPAPAQRKPVKPASQSPRQSTPAPTKQKSPRPASTQPKQSTPTPAPRKAAPQPQVVASEKKTTKQRPTAAQFRNRASATLGGSSANKRPISTQSAPSRRRVPGLDGVRGIAVVAVLLYHFWPHLFPGGFMGVDMFFVLSGYLITFLLVREYRKTGRISLKQFWLRRARRILPAALVVIAICTALVSLFRGDIAVKVGYHAWTSALFVSNWGQIAESGSYFSDNDLNIFTHYWSLSIEEQFYLVWPLLVIGLLALGLRSRTVQRLVQRPAKKAGKPSDATSGELSLLLYTTIAIGAASFLAMLVLYNPDEDPTRVYFGTDTHAFGLAVGAAIAFVVSQGATITSPRRSPDANSTGALSRLNLTLEAGAWIGFVALLAMLLTVQDTSSFTYRGGLLIASLLTGWLVMLSVRGEGTLVNVLSHPSLAWFGDRSFSLYLWHWPLLLMSRQFFTQTLDMHGDVATHVIVPFTALVATVAGTYVTYHYVENPFRMQGYRKTLLSLKGPRLAATTATTSLVAVGIVVALVTAPAQTNVEKQLEALAAQQQKAKSSQNATATGAAADPNASPMKTHQLPRGRAITAIGDSVMLASYDALKKRYPEIFIDAGVSRHYSGGQPILQNLKAQKKLRNTVILGFGTNGQAFPGQLDEMLDVIGPDRTVILVAPYGPVNGVPEAAQQVVDFAAKHPNVFPAMWCQVAANNRNALYSDGVHPKPENAGLYVRAITDALQQAASGQKQPRQTCPPM